MLDSLRKKDSTSRPAAPAAPMSPYQRMQAALSPSTGSHAPLNAPEAARSDAPKSDAPGSDGVKPDPASNDTKISVSTAPQASAAAATGESVSRLIVGPDIKLKGAEITDCDTLVVEGRVEAAMDSRVIQIADIGMFVGKAGVDTAEIRGHFEGELTARKQLIIRSTGRVSGKIRYGKVTIEEGGELSGDVAALGGAANAGIGYGAEPLKSPAGAPN